MSLVKSSLDNQPYYYRESIFRAFKRKEMKTSTKFHDVAGWECASYFKKRFTVTFYSDEVKNTTAILYCYYCVTVEHVGRGRTLNIIR
jgi:hypothetical protein